MARRMHRRGMFEEDHPEFDTKNHLLGSSGQRLDPKPRTRYKNKPPTPPKLSKKFKSPHRRGVI